LNQNFLFLFEFLTKLQFLSKKEVCITS